MILGDALDWLERIVSDREIEKSVDRVEGFLRATGKVSGRVERPVYFFNASTRIHRLSINAAISLISSWKIRYAGHPVNYLVCERGMEQCILGTDRQHLDQPPPCEHCLKFSELLFPRELTIPLTRDPQVFDGARDAVDSLNLDGCMNWTYRGIPLGELCLPSIRWSLRRHHLEDSPDTLGLYRRYLASAASIASRLEVLFTSNPPQALVVFNGLTYPEAVARLIGRSMGLPVFTHEVGLRPYSAFYSSDEATFRGLDLPDKFQLSPNQESELDQYLADRFQGRSSMAGIQFWPEIASLPEAIVKKMGAFEETVPIFTNVIFDTSQVHANTIYPQMFAWLDDLLEVIDSHPTTLFILRAHPDEHRPGKESQESVSMWVEKVDLKSRENVFYLSPEDSVSSYEIIQESKFVLVYNSSIGLEASILGVPTLCAGRARYTQLPIVHFPEDRKAYLAQLNRFLEIHSVPHPEQFRSNARRFLYFELFRASLDFAPFLRSYPRAPGMVTLTDLDPEEMLNSRTLEIIERGVLEGEGFEYPAES